jgi:hypothetical protein
MGPTTEFRAPLRCRDDHAGPMPTPMGLTSGEAL